MNIYNINKYHPAWGWYIELEDIEYIGPGRKCSPEARKDLKKRSVDGYMRSMCITAEQLEADFKARTLAKKVHSYYIGR